MEAPLTFRKNGFNYTLISLGHNACIYEQLYSKKVTYFEVWIMKIRKGTEKFGKVYPDSFAIPGNEDFGNWAWTFRDKEKAIAEFNRLENIT
jgi:hypothetical protein